MVPRRFTTKIEQCHRKWLGEALDLPLTGHNGIDYCNDFFAIELKSAKSKRILDQFCCKS